MDFFDLLILLFIMVPILEGIMRTKKKGSDDGIPPGTRRPPPGPADDVEEASMASSTDEAAAEMIPDDLWQILTGESRGPVAAPPGREEDEAGSEWADVTQPREGRGDPGSDMQEEVWWDPAERGGEGVRPRDREHEPLRSMDTAEAYSLEREPDRPLDEEAFVRTVPSAEVRHRRFHEKIDALHRARPRKRARRLPLGLDDPDQVRRGIILQTVLGPPKALE